MSLEGRDSLVKSSSDIFTHTHGVSTDCIRHTGNNQFYKTDCNKGPLSMHNESVVLPSCRLYVEIIYGGSTFSSAL